MLNEIFSNLGRVLVITSIKQAVEYLGGWETVLTFIFFIVIAISGIVWVFDKITNKDNKK